MRGIVVAAQPEAAEAGVEVLRQGGNAVDAAIACAFSQGVVDPQMCGIGGFGAMQSTQREFLDDLEKRLTRHSAAMAGWLADYGTKVEAQTAERMNTWNTQTEAFTSGMIQATQALSDAVDELSLPNAARDAGAAA